MWWILYFRSYKGDARGQNPYAMILLNKDDFNVSEHQHKLKPSVRYPSFTELHTCFTFEEPIGATSTLNRNTQGLYHCLMDSDISEWSPVVENVNYLRLLIDKGHSVSIITSIPNYSKLVTWLNNINIVQVCVHYDAPRADFFSGNCICVNSVAISRKRSAFIKQKNHWIEDI